MWNDLTMSERAGVIKMAVKAGLRDMKSIRDFYDNSLKYADGGSINISPSKRGTFTAAATKHGMGVQEFASRVLANKDNYSPAMVKKANFAKNASKWKHDLGGYLLEEGGPKATYGKPYYSYDKNMQIETDNGKPILNYSATLPEVTIIPDSKKSPADRNADERFRQKTFSDYTEHKDREYTQSQIMRSQRDWDNSLEKKALGYAQDAMTGIGIGADIVSGYPVYSSLKGARVLSEANSLPEYIEGGLWLAPIGGVVGKEAYNIGKNAWNTSKNTIKNTIGDIGKNSKTTPVDFNNLTPEQWTAAQDAAIARGDMTEVQRLRDLHFKVNAPNTKIVDKNGNPLHTYHGGQKGITAFLNPNEFDKSIKLNNYYKDGRNRIGIYTSDWKSYAKQYAKGYKKKDRDIYDLYVNTENPRYVSYLETKLNQLRNLNPFRKKDYLNPSVIRPEHKEQLLSGYDGVKWDIENVVFNGKQLKSADAITYDNNGVRIPLGERDNFKINDIRYGIIPLIGGASLYKNKKKVK